VGQPTGSSIPDQTAARPRHRHRHRDSVAVARRPSTAVSGAGVPAASPAVSAAGAPVASPA